MKSFLLVVLALQLSFVLVACSGYSPQGEVVKTVTGESESDEGQASDMAKEDETEKLSQELWGWFSANAAQVRAEWKEGRLGEPSTATEGLSECVEKLGLRWELGPWGDGQFLAVWPVLKKEIALAERVVALAPSVPGWTFLSMRPPRMWRGAMNISGDEVDPSTWQYKLQQWEDGALGVIFGLPESKLSEKDRQSAGWMILSLLLGDRVTLQHFVDVKMTDLADWEDTGNELRLLRGQVAQLSGSIEPFTPSGRELLLEAGSPAIDADGLLVQAVGFKVSDGGLAPILEAGHRVPWEHSQKFATASADEESLMFELFRGRSGSRTDVHSLGKVKISGFSRQPGERGAVTIRIIARDRDLELDAFDERAWQYCHVEFVK